MSRVDLQTKTDRATRGCRSYIVVCHATLCHSVQDSRAHPVSQGFTEVEEQNRVTEHIEAELVAAEPGLPAGPSRALRK